MESNMEIYKNPPKTIEQIGTQMFYMARDLQKIEASLSDTPSRKELEELKVRVATLEVEIIALKEGRHAAFKEVRETYVSKNEFKLGMGVITVILSTAIALFTLWEKLKG